ncbi:MAG: polyphosphate kinase 2 [Flavobacteriales bacterium]|jgi:polyphosphate kinase 2
MFLTKEDLESLKTREDVIKLAEEKNFKLEKYLWDLDYEKQLKKLQGELVNLQKWISDNKLRVAILFEGRDSAGKGGAIKRFTEHLNPRSMRVVALSKPTEVEKGQWYFRRYIKELPNPGEIVFFDRSWYNRAVVEPAMSFCSEEQYKQFVLQVPEFEHMLYEDGVTVIKFWFSITKEEQAKRFASRLENPLKRWKFSPVDQEGQRLWNEYTHYKEQMFSKTHTDFSPWIIIKTNDKRTARLEAMRYVLSKFDYAEKTNIKANLLPDPNVVARYYRHLKQFD